jgi:hypothetical protein
MTTLEKSKPIKINNQITKNDAQNLNIKYYNEFDLKSSCFDPAKFSPPNEFIIKLNMRMNHHNNLRSRLSE